ncbi:MAG: glycosyltransferase family 1 protein [Planctomycetota bacterium]|nr:glycosyltransferase family 1 protein [Planctomycetota bacterium]
MKVGIDYRSALVNREGIGRTTREIVRALVELGHAEELALFGWTLAPMKFTRTELGLANSDAHLSRWRFPARWIPGLCERTQRGTDDLVGGCDVFHHTQPHLLPVRRAVEVATIFDCIYLRPNRFVSPAAAEKMTEAARAMVARARHIVVPSQFVADDVALRLGVECERIHVVLLGCDHVLREARPDARTIAHDAIAVTVSRVDSRKNHVRMLRVFERLVAEKLLERWIVAGPDGHGYEAFEAALATSPVRSRVERLHHVEDRDLAGLYRRASVFLFASLDEGFGLPPLEALACGAPVVAADNSSMPEVLGDAVLLVNAEDEDALFAAAKRLIVERDFADVLRERGLARASELTWRNCAQSMWDVYRVAAETPRA